VIAARALSGVDTTAPHGVAKERLNEAVRLAADHLGNTVAVCRRCYIHPRVLSAYRDGSLPKIPSTSRGARDRAVGGNLRADERAVLRLLADGA
jgi:DNA topoisomerase-1